MVPLGAPTVGDTGSSSVSVLLDGRVVGEVSQAQAADIAIKLRTLKALGKEKVHPYSQPWNIIYAQSLHESIRIYIWV